MSRLQCRDRPDFDVDTTQLEQRYKGAQRELHPDKFGQRSSQEQQYSADHSAQVNLAYNTLRSPLSRAVYMVSPSTERLHSTDYLGLCPNCVRHPALSLKVLGLMWDCSDLPLSQLAFWSTPLSLRLSLPACAIMPIGACALQLQKQGVAEVDSEGTIADPAYLMDIMELREQIDSTEDEAELKQLLAENQAKQRDAVQVPQFGMLCWARHAAC